MADESPITVLAIGTGTGDGRAPTTQMVTTSLHQKDVVLKFVTPLAAITISFVWMFLTVLVTVITAAGVAPDMIPFADFRQLLEKASSVALTGACLNLLKDLLTLFTDLKNRFPLLNL